MKTITIRLSDEQYQAIDQMLRSAKVTARNMDPRLQKIDDAGQYVELLMRDWSSMPVIPERSEG